MSYNDRIKAAISVTKSELKGYWDNTLKQRIPGEGSAGSVLTPWWGAELKDEAISLVVEEKMKAAEWTEAQHPAVMAGCALFTTPAMTGRMGVVLLSSLPEEAIVMLDDRKNTGKVSCTVKGILGEEVNFVSIILGMENDKEVVYTFHPGWPVKVSQVECQEGMHGKEVTVKEAMELGLLTAKIV